MCYNLSTNLNSAEWRFGLCYMINEGGKDDDDQFLEC